MSKQHLRFCCRSANGHAQVVMKNLGVTYQLAVPQSMADQWWFFNCENTPDPLPEFLTPLNLDPHGCVGYGLSQKDADAIAANN